MDDLQRTLIDISRGGAQAAAISGGYHWPRELAVMEALVAGDPAPVYAPPPGGSEPQGDRPDDKDAPQPDEGPMPLQSAPFQVGRRVIDRRHPFAAMTVTRCYRTARGYWRVEWRIEQSAGEVPLSPMVGSQQADHLIQVPSDWQDCPAQPRSTLDLLELSTDGPLGHAAQQEAYDADAGDAQQAKLRAYYAARRRWAENFLWPIARELGNAEIACMDSLIRDVDAGMPAAALRRSAA